MLVYSHSLYNYSKWSYLKTKTTLLYSTRTTETEEPRKTVPNAITTKKPLNGWTKSKKERNKLHKNIKRSKLTQMSNLSALIICTETKKLQRSSENNLTILMNYWNRPPNPLKRRRETGSEYSTMIHILFLWNFLNLETIDKHYEWNLLYSIQVNSMHQYFKT